MIQRYERHVADVVRVLTPWVAQGPLREWSLTLGARRMRLEPRMGSRGYYGVTGLNLGPWMVFGDWRMLRVPSPTL